MCNATWIKLKKRKKTPQVQAAFFPHTHLNFHLSSYTLELQAMAKSSRLSLAPVMANHGRPPWTVTKFRHNKLPLQWLLLFSHLSWVFDDDAFGLFFRVVFVNFG